MRRFLALSALTMALAAPAMAQDHQHDADKAVQGGGTLPTGWMARTDRGAPLTNVKFADMPPGWHVTLGPAAVFYQPSDTTSGNAHLVGLFHLFPGATHPEGYGLILGGTDLQGPAQAYTYFLVRGDGKFLIKRRSGDSTTSVVNWTANDAVKAADSTGHASNELTILIKDGTVSFMANGKEVYKAPAADLDTKGVVGVRMNHNLSVHLEKLQVHRI
jgi:opacity protein-like surface antigen